MSGEEEYLEWVQSVEVQKKKDPYTSEGGSRRDLPSDQDLSSATELVHQVHHALVVIHIHCDLLVSLDMGKSKTVSNLNLAARSGRSGLGRSDTEQGSNHSRLFGRFTRLMVEDLSQDRGVDGDERRSSSIKSKNDAHISCQSEVLCCDVFAPLS